MYIRYPDNIVHGGWKSNSTCNVNTKKYYSNEKISKLTIICDIVEKEKDLNKSE